MDYQSPPVLMLSTEKHIGEEKDFSQPTYPLLVLSLENVRLAERIERALRATGYGALRAIKVSVNARIIRLVGQVPSYYLKQIAQVAALAIPGTHEIRNDLDVIPSP